MEKGNIGYMTATCPSECLHLGIVIQTEWTILFYLSSRNGPDQNDTFVTFAAAQLGAQITLSTFAWDVRDTTFVCICMSPRSGHERLQVYIQDLSGKHPCTKKKKQCSIHMEMRGKGSETGVK